MKRLLAVFVCLTVILSCFALSAIADDSFLENEDVQTTVESQTGEGTSEHETDVGESATEETA